MCKLNLIMSSITKSIFCVSILALSMLGFSTFNLAAAQTGEQSAEGSFSYAIEDGSTNSIEFRAERSSDGRTEGRMTFSGEVEIPDQDVDGTGDREFSGPLQNISLEASFDGLVVERNRAVMSGVVTGCALGDYIGRRVLLIVEDNGNGIARGGDQFTFGFYKTVERDWVPSDADFEHDDGASLTWIATDAEFKDDEGVPYPLVDVPVNSQSFPVSSYSFAEVTSGEGDIQVQE